MEKQWPKDWRGFEPAIRLQPLFGQRKTLVYPPNVDQGGTTEAGANRTPNVELVGLGEFQYGFGVVRLLLSLPGI